MPNRHALVLSLVAALACAGEPSSPRVAANLATGLEGIVLRGPVQPVCRVGEPCDAPFSATLEAWQQQQFVARFQSDSLGNYQVLLPPGAYTITVDSGASLWPTQQPHDITVGPVGLTHANLTFDTGIR